MANKNEDKETKKVDTKKAKSNDKDKKSFAKDFKAELKKVTWPTPKQLVNNTTAVIVSVLVVAAIVFILDVAFESLNNYGVEKLKALVTSEAQNTVDVNEVDGATVIDGSTDTNEVSDETTTEPVIENTDTNTTAEDTNTVADANVVADTNTANTSTADTNTVDTNTTSPEGQSGQ